MPECEVRAAAHVDLVFTGVLVGWGWGEMQRTR